MLQSHQPRRLWRSFRWWCRQFGHCPDNRQLPIRQRVQLLQNRRTGRGKMWRRELAGYRLQRLPGFDRRDSMEQCTFQFSYQICRIWFRANICSQSVPNLAIDIEPSGC